MKKKILLDNYINRNFTNLLKQNLIDKFIKIKLKWSQTIMKK